VAVALLLSKAVTVTVEADPAVTGDVADTEKCVAGGGENYDRTLNGWPWQIVGDVRRGDGVGSRCYQSEVEIRWGRDCCISRQRCGAIAAAELHGIGKAYSSAIKLIISSHEAIEALARRGSGWAAESNIISCAGVPRVPHHGALSADDDAAPAVAREVPDCNSVSRCAGVELDHPLRTRGGELLPAELAAVSD